MLDQPIEQHDTPLIDRPRPKPEASTEPPKRHRGIVVVGSINMDLVIRATQLPRPGQTVHGSDFHTLPGGKGANQAIAAARLEAEVRLIGCVGEDAYGRQLLDHLRNEQVDIKHVRITPDRPSGVAIIQVDSAGENAITHIAAANSQLCPDDLNVLEPAIASASALLCQLEVPMSTVCAALRIARRHRVMTVLDPAPAPKHDIPDELYEVDVLSPNQTETEQMTGERVESVAEAKLVGAELVRRGARCAALKLGGEGAVIVTESGLVQHIPPFRTTVTDTTAAGDAFTAALTVGLTEGMSYADAARMGCAAGALAVRTIGAGQSMPTRAQVMRLMRSQC